MQAGFELNAVVSNHVTFQSPAESCDKPVTNWILSAAVRDTTLYIGDSSGQLTQMNFTAVENPKKVLQKIGVCALTFVGETVALSIHRSRVRVLAGRHCVVALDKLLTPVYLCHQAV